MNERNKKEKEMRTERKVEKGRTKERNCRGKSKKIWRDRERERGEKEKSGELMNRLRSRFDLPCD